MRYVRTIRMSTQQGFTLVETLVAITVLVFALVGPFSAVQHSLFGSYIARDELTASALAQEGAEYVRSIRDNNFLSSRVWMDGVSTLGCFGVTPTSYCSVDPSQGDPHTSGVAVRSYSQLASVPVLYLDSSNLYNQQSSGTQSRFRRAVQFREISADEVEVTVRVEWVTKGTTYFVTVTDVLHRWL